MSASLISVIKMMAQNYGVDYRLAHDIFLCVYYGMIAEENKANTRLGALIKMNGVHSFLRANHTVEYAANSCKGVAWDEILKEANARGIYRVVKENMVV